MVFARDRTRTVNSNGLSLPQITQNICICVVFFLASLCGDVFAQTQVTAEKIGSRVDVVINGSFFTSYIFSDDEKYPFFYPVNGPSGASVTSMRNSNFPHHSSLFFGADHVNGGNYWQEGLEEGQIISARVDVVESGGEQVVIENETLWVRPGAESPFKDTRRITISAPADDIYQIDFDISLHALQDVTIERTNHSLFSGRMDPDLAVINGGVMVNAEGHRGEEETFGVRSSWISYYGFRGGDQAEGMTIMQHPSNEWYPAPWFTRDYGFFSPTPLYWPEDGDRTVLRDGNVVQMRYRVIVHAGDHEEAAIADRFEAYINE